MEMRPLVERTGGYIVMSESFTGNIFKQSFKAVFARDAAGQGLRELKTAIRKIFGKVDCHKLGSLTLASTGAIAKKNDLKDGCTVVCHYTYAPGDPSAFGGRRRGGFGGFRRGGGSDRERMLLMLMARGYGMF